jgi:hypothetical protein
MKPMLKTWLADGRLDLVEDAIARRHRLLGTLFTLTYDSDPLIVKRAIEAYGRAAARIAASRPEFVREHLRRLFWLITDESGGIAWHAPEAIGEVIRNRPEEFLDFVPLLVSVLDLEPEDLVRFLAGTLYAIGRLAEAAPESLSGEQRRWIRGQAERALASPDPQVRGMALWCLARLPGADAAETAWSLAADAGPVVLYVDGQIETTTVARLADAWRPARPPAGGGRQ